MTSSVPDSFIRALNALPLGTHPGHVQGRRYLVSKTMFNEGRSLKLVAEEIGGRDYISLNFYDLRTGPRLFPCEMPVEKVVAFVTRFTPDQDAA